jgi:hypothetical protein
MRATAVYGRYDDIADHLVLASHSSLCMTNGTAPIFDLCRFGMNNVLREYAVGPFQDLTSFAV